MYDRKVKRLPVTDANGHLVGIISRADVLSIFDRTDKAIRREILDEVLRDFLVDPLAFDVTVKDGIVTLVRRPETSETGQEIVRREPRRPPRSVTHWCARPGTFPVWSRSATASATPTSTRSSRARCSEP